MARVLIVDDERGMRITLKEFLLGEGHQVETTGEAGSAVELLNKSEFDIVVTDIVLPKMNGLDLMQSIRKKSDSIQVILITGDPTVDSAVQAVRAGAFDYLAKPISGEAICRVVANAERVKKLNDENRRLMEEIVRHKEHLEELVDERSRELRKSEETYRTLVEAAEVVIANVDYEGTFLFMNSIAARQMGGEAKDLIGKRYTDLFPPETAANHLIAVRQVIDSGKGFQVEAPTVVQGKLRWFRTNLQPLKDVSGEYKSALIVSTDIHEQKKMLEELKESEKRYRFVTDNVSDVIWTVDMDLRFTFVSPSVERLEGITVEEAMKRTFMANLTPESASQMQQVLEEELELEASGEAELRRSRIVEAHQVRRDGSLAWIEVAGSFLRDENMKPIGILGVTRDITRRKLSEIALKESEKIYRNLAEMTGDGICMVRDMKFEFINNSLAEILGYEVDELLGSPFLDTIDPADHEYISELHRRHTGGERKLGIHEIRAICKDGSYKRVSIDASIITLQGDAVQLVNIRDLKLG